MSTAAMQDIPSVTVNFSSLNVDHSISPTQQIISSCSGAMLTSLFMTPLDVVKIRLQSQHKPFRRGTCFVYNNGLMECFCVCSHCVETNGKSSSRQSRSMVSVAYLRPWYERPGHFTGTMDAFVKITRNEGISALWSGLPPTLFVAVPATVIYYTMYDRIKYALGYDEKNQNTKYLPILAGAGARVMAATIINPIEIVRTKMQSMPLGYHQLGKAVQVSIESEGLRVLMKGLGPSLLRDVPFSGIYWYSYESCKALQLKKMNRNDLTFTESFVCGALSGLIAAVITVPFDVIKTHRQIEFAEQISHPELGKKPSSSTWVLIAQLYRERGFSALYAGIVPRMIKVAPACAIMISTYEYGKSFFRNRNALRTAD